jgi:hypothetical protein
VIGTYNCHGWLWDIDLGSIYPLHHFPLFNFFWDMYPNYQHPFIHVVNLDDPNVWVQVCEQHATLFERVMPMLMEHLAIAQH